MRFFDLFKKKKKKISLYKTEDSYRDILYQSEDKSISEVIFNRTNLKAPKYVSTQDESIRLYYNRSIGSPIAGKAKVLKGREFVYQSAEEYIREKSITIKWYWDCNFENCKKRYSSYEEFFALNCQNMNKPRIKVVTNDYSR